MKSLFNRLVMASVAVLVMGRLGYLGYEKHVAPRIEGFMNPTAVIENQAPLSAAGYDMLSALRKIDDWELKTDRRLDHKPSNQINITLPVQGNLLSADQPVKVCFGKDNITTLYTAEDLKAIDKAATSLAGIIRERTMATARENLQKALGSNTTENRVKEALKPEAGLEVPTPVPVPTFQASLAPHDAGLKTQLPWYERNSTLMLTSIGGMIVTTLFMGWVARRRA